MRNAKKIAVILITVLVIALLFVTCRKRLEKNEIIEIKAAKVSPQETDKVISAIQNKKEEPVAITIEAPDAIESGSDKTVEETVEEFVEDSVEDSIEDISGESVKEEVQEDIPEENNDGTVDTTETSDTTETDSKTAVEETTETDTETEAVETVDTTETDTKTEITETVQGSETTNTDSEANTELFNPPVKAKEIPIKKKKSYGIGMEIGLGVGYYRLEYNDYKADMLKISIPVYLCFAQSDSFSISAYVKPGYLKELKKDNDSSPLTVDYAVKKQDYCFECGVGLNSYSNNFSLRTDLGLDFFNPGTKINNPHTMLNLQIVPSFRLGKSKLWLSIPFEGSISLENKDSRAYGAGVYISLRTDETKK